MAPTLNATTTMAEKNDTQFSWNHTSFEIKTSDVLLATEHDLDLLHILPVSVAILIGIPGNSYVMYWIRDRTSPSLVDSMIFLDCIANIGVLLSILLTYPKQIWGNIPFCLFTQACKSFFITLNRVIPVTIATFSCVKGRDTLNYHSIL